jgi:hypothetical protein
MEAVMASGMGVADGNPPDEWPPAELAAQLDQPTPHTVWPGPELEPALGAEGMTELTPAPTARQHAAGER